MISIANHFEFANEIKYVGIVRRTLFQEEGIIEKIYIF